MSRTTFTSPFKTVAGVPPLTYLLNCRLEPSTTDARRGWLEARDRRLELLGQRRLDPSGDAHEHAAIRRPEMVLGPKNCVDLSVSWM
jgi:hypothetical protein